MDLGNSNESIQIREMVERAMMRINTSIPGIIESFDASTITATVAPAIKMRTTIDGVSSTIELPKLINVPVIAPVAVTNGFALTLPVATGDSCLLIFSQRSFENWHQLGGVQPPEDGVGSRHHHLTDAFALMAPVATPDVFSNWITDGIEIRNKNASMKATFKNDSIVFIVGGVTTTLNSSGLTCSADVADSKGTMEEMRGVYNGHTHPETGVTTQAPTQQMT